jgi:hypothetical protein
VRRICFRVEKLPLLVEVEGDNPDGMQLAFSVVLMALNNFDERRPFVSLFLCPKEFASWVRGDRDSFVRGLQEETGGTIVLPPRGADMEEVPFFGVGPSRGAVDHIFKRLVQRLESSPAYRQGQGTPREEPRFQSLPVIPRMPGDRDVHGMIVNALASAYGFRIVPVRGDGACFFRAISMALYACEDQHEELRQRTVDIIQACEDLHPFLTEPLAEHVRQDCGVPE